MTKARRAVIDVLDGAGQPLSVAGVVARMEGACDQATVYRALHFLEDHGQAESFVLSCSEHGVERYYASRAAPHRHWFHCESCHRFTDLGLCRMGGFVQGVEDELGLRVRRHVLYLTGTCASCAAERGTAGLPRDPGEARGSRGSRRSPRRRPSGSRHEKRPRRGS